MKKRNKVIDINKWPRTINQKRSMEQLAKEKKNKREEKIKQFEREVDQLLKQIED